VTSSFRPRPEQLRDPATNQYYLKGLFIEGIYGVNDTENIPYTLKSADHTLNGLTFISLERLYKEMNDPTEINFARTYLADWKHWLKLQKCSWFKPIIQRWREEAGLVRRARYLEEVETIARGDGKFQLAALKMLLQEDKPATRQGKGRPSNLDVQRELKKAAQELNEEDEDYKRILNHGSSTAD
jgi:hypothetical protein